MSFFSPLCVVRCGNRENRLLEGFSFDVYVCVFSLVSCVGLDASFLLPLLLLLSVVFLTLHCTFYPRKGGGGFTHAMIIISFPYIHFLLIPCLANKEKLFLSC